MDFVEGEIIHINKPLQWTSFSIVNFLRLRICKSLNIKKLKVGHAGTLDPLATGVLIICTGKKTKDIQNIQNQRKEYIADIHLGATTPSFDLETEIDATYPIDHINEHLINTVLKSFVGEIEQIPPIYSACKVKGRRAYDFARKNEIIELKPKILVIDEIELINISMPIIKIRVVCSKGTYIRALARDIGQSLKSGAHLVGLVRTFVGNVSLQNCINIDDIDKYIKQEIK